MNFFGFRGREAFGVVLILSTIICITLVNLQTSYRKSRDAQRKADIRSYYDRLQKFQADYGFYPESINGQIKGCNPQTVNNELIFEICGPDNNSPYFSQLPTDPKTDEGYKYVYISNQKHFQVYASLESASEDEYDENIIQRNLSCGTQICNFGRSDGKTPLDKNLEKYENE